ncbi:MAG: AsmA family protein, partial [Candidatus Omnitrophica bacterium]|nr:AsmA family protein [Candidatus Omnitrophota bacterium]
MKSFLKFLKISALVFLILILLVLVGGFIFLKTFDIKKYKTQIIEAADKALGRHLEFNDIELKVSLKE